MKLDFSAEQGANGGEDAVDQMDGAPEAAGQVQLAAAVIPQSPVILAQAGAAGVPQGPFVPMVPPGAVSTTAGSTTAYAIGVDGVVRLPAGTVIQNAEVVGNDLHIVQPNGTLIVIVNGGVMVPVIFIGGVAFNQDVIAALVGQGPQPAGAGAPAAAAAAGGLGSAGGEFGQAAGPIDPNGINLTALLGPTALQFGGREVKGIGFVVDTDPTAGENPGVIVDDDDRSGGNAGGVGDDTPANLSGVLNHDFGSNPGAIAFLDSGAPAGFAYQLSGTSLLIVQNETLVLTVSLNPQTGAYTVTQNNPLDHAPGSNENNQDFTLTYRVTDADGDFAEGTLDIGVDDDTPTIGPNASAILDDDNLAGGNDGGVGDDAPAGVSGTLNFSAGGDGGSIAFLTTGAPSGFTYELSGSSLLIKQGAATVLTLTLNTATGAYTITQNARIIHAGGSDENNQSFTVSYHATDGDGDTLDGTLAISVDDDTPTVTSNTTVLLDDDALAGGNAGGTGDDANSANVSGTLGHSFGADGGSIAFLTSGAPAGFTYELSGSSLLVKQGATTVLTVTLNTATGAYAVTQNARIAHAAGSDENNQAFTIAYRVTDSDGDTADGALAINVDDDTPTVASNATVLLDDDALAGGNPSGTNDDANSANVSGTLGNSLGADGGSIAFLTTGAPAGFTYELSGSSLLIKQGATTVLTVTLNTATGAYTVTQNARINHAAGSDENNQALTLTYRVSDGDGDTVNGTLSINVDDDTPTVSANATVLLDDDALAGGNAGGTNDDANSANVSGTLGNSLGADGGSIAFLTTGAPTGFTYELSGSSLLIKQGATTVLTVTLNSATGAYGVTQNAPIVHAAGNSENNQAFTLAYRVTDGDGDSVDGTLSINVDDDTPTVSANAMVLLDDDALAGGNAGGTNDDANSANVSGTLGNSFGADGGSIAFLTTGAPAGFTYELSGSSLLVKQGATTVLTVTLNTATGAYTVTQNAPVTHAAGSDENNQVFTVAYRITDGDGDIADGALSINVDDDTPTVTENAPVQLDDDALASGTAGGTNDDANSANVSGTLGNSFGADGGSIAFLTTGAPAGFTYELSGSSLLIKQGATTVLTVTLNTATGAYGVTQNAPIVHAAGSEENNQAFAIGYRVTDGDGDAADGTLFINVDDDTPTISENAPVQLDDDALAGGNAGGTNDDADSANVSGTLGHSFGADSGSIAFLTSGAPASFTYELSGSDLLIKQGTTTVLTVTLNTATGAYAVTQNNPIAHAAGDTENNQAFTLTYRVTDGDNDFVDGTLSINVDDDTPTVASNATVLLDDDALTGGNAGGTNDDADSAFASGTLGHSFGADSGSIAFLTSGAPAGFTYELSGSDLLIKQGATTVLTVTLNTATGAYTVTQNNPILHAAGDTENNQAFTLTYRVTDGDNDFVDGTLSINVDDDTPTVASNATVLLDDDALTGGNAGGTNDDADSANLSGTLGHSFGADSGSIAFLTSGAPAGFTYELSGSDLLIKQGATTFLTVTLNSATGAYTVTQNNPILHAAGDTENNQAFTLTYRVTDGDNDFVDGTLSINVDDDTPTVASNATVLLDDDALTGGNAGGTNDDADSANLSGTLGHSFGADGGSIAFLTTGAPSGFTYELSGSDLLIKQGATTVLTVTLNTTTGAYTVTQNNPIAHAAGLDENNQAFAITYRVTDGDSDFVDGTLSINVDDDTPTVASNATVLLDDDALAGGNAGGTNDDANSANASGTLGHSFGADGGSIAFLTTGAPSGFTYELSGSSLLIKQGATTVLTITLNTATGAYGVTQNAAIVHASGDTENNQAFAITYRVTDGDGDTTDGTLSINVDDDTPTVASNATVLLDDDALAGGSAGGIDDDVNGANVSGTLGHSFGADGGSIAFLTSGAPSGFTYELSGSDLLVKQGTTIVLTVTLNTTTGAYAVTQNNPILHAAGLAENNEVFAITYRVTDGDGDTVDGTLNINVDDDMPMSAPNNTVVLDDDALTGGNAGGTDDDGDSANVAGVLEHRFGADGGSIAFLTFGAPSGFTYELSGSDLLIKQGTTTVLTVTLNTATGAYAVTQNNPILHAAGDTENNQTFQIRYRVTDTDGDHNIVDGTLNINVDDDTPTVASNATVLLDDDALAGGNAGGTNDDADSANVSGTLGHSFGADAGSIAFLTTGAPTGFTYELSGSDLLIKQGATTVLTVTLNSATGAYAVTQNNPIAHAAGDTENNQAFTLTYRVTDGDSDFVDGTLNINVDDDTPTVASNATILLDDDVLAGGNAGGTNDDADSANLSGTLGHSFGADGGSIAFLTTGAPSGFTYELSGSDLLIKQGATTVLTVTLNTATGLYTVTQNNPLVHAAGLDENNQSFTLTYRVTDGDNDFVDGTLNINVDDDTPVIAEISDLIYSNSSNPTPGGTGIFDYSIGADARSAYSASNSDFSPIALTGTVGTNAITSASVVWFSESASNAVFNVSFTYQPNPTDAATTNATGTLTFDKVNGTYTLSLSQPLDGFSFGTTSGALNRIGYQPNSFTPDSTQPMVAVSQITSDFFVQFSGYAEPGSGTGANNLQAGGNTAWVPGEVITQASEWVSVTNESNGVGGDTMGKGEVLDMDFFITNPGGFTGTTPTAAAKNIYFRIDSIGSADMIVILKLVDPDDLSRTTKAIIVENGDVFKFGEALPAGYNVTLDNNDGLVIIESNDYNAGSENWQIEGLQVLSSSEGITGTGINLNRVAGDLGGSSGTQAFDAGDNDGFKVQDIGVLIETSGTLDADLDFSFSVVDADGDATGTQVIDIHIEGNSAFTGTAVAESIQGSAGVDTVNGGGGDDILAGGLGDDQLTGGAGADTFVMTPGGGVDTIADYVLADDAVDLSALLDQALIESGDAGDLSDFVKLTAGSELQIDPNGTDGGTNFTTVAVFSPATATTVHILYDSQEANVSV